MATGNGRMVQCGHLFGWAAVSRLGTRPSRNMVKEEGGAQAPNTGAFAVLCQHPDFPLYGPLLLCTCGQSDTDAESCRSADKAGSYHNHPPIVKRLTWPSPHTFPPLLSLIQISQQNQPPIQNPTHNTHNAQQIGEYLQLLSSLCKTQVTAHGRPRACASIIFGPKRIFALSPWIFSLDAELFVVIQRLYLCAPLLGRTAIASTLVISRYPHIMALDAAQQANADFRNSFAKPTN
jgi:hypothetical protein